MVQLFDPKARGLLLTDNHGKVHFCQQMVMQEKVSEPFLMKCTLFSSEFSVKDQLGQRITCSWNERMGSKQHEKRRFNGHISSIKQLDGYDEFDTLTKYEIEVRPWLWMLKFGKKNRIFQQDKLGDILSFLFNEAGFSGYYTLDNLPNTMRPFCMQYGETDLDFIHRILSEEGIGYFFEHEKGKHTLHFHMANMPFSKGGIAKIGLKSYAKGDIPILQNWTSGFLVHSGSVQVAGYDYSTSKVVEKKKLSQHKIAHTSQLVADTYPRDSIGGNWKDLKTTLLDLDLARVESKYHRTAAESRIDDLELATVFSLAAHPDPSQLGDYAVVAITHHLEASQQSVRYQNQFECIPVAQHFVTPLYC